MSNQKLSKCCHQPAVFTKYHKDYPLGEYFCSGVNGCGNWCELEEPTQGEEFDWEELGKKLLDLEIKINPTNKFDAETLKEKRSIILLVWHDFLFEPILAFIKDHCVPRQSYLYAKDNLNMSMKSWEETESKLAAANQEIALLRGKLEAVMALLKQIDKEKWDDAIHCTCLGYAIDRVEKEILTPSPKEEKK